MSPIQETWDSLKTSCPLPPKWTVCWFWAGANLTKVVQVLVRSQCLLWHQFFVAPLCWSKDAGHKLFTHQLSKRCPAENDFSQNHTNGLRKQSVTLPARRREEGHKLKKKFTGFAETCAAQRTFQGEVWSSLNLLISLSSTVWRAAHSMN